MKEIVHCRDCKWFSRTDVSAAVGTDEERWGRCTLEGTMGALFVATDDHPYDIHLEVEANFGCIQGEPRPQSTHLP